MARSYSGLLRNRLILVGLTLGLVTVIFGVLLDIFLSSQRTTIARPTQQLIAPLDPRLNLEVIERLEQYELVTFEQAREGVRQSRLEQGSGALVEVGSIAPPVEMAGGDIVPVAPTVPAQSEFSEPATESAAINQAPPEEPLPSTP